MRDPSFHPHGHYIGMERVYALYIVHAGWRFGGVFSREPIPCEATGLATDWAGNISPFPSFLKDLAFNKAHELSQHSPHVDPSVICLIRQLLDFLFLQLVCVCVCVCSDGIHPAWRRTTQPIHRWTRHVPPVTASTSSPCALRGSALFF